MFTRLFMHFWLIIEFFVFWICGLFSYKYHCRLRYELSKMFSIIEFDSINLDHKISRLKQCKTYSEVQKIDLN